MDVSINRQMDKKDVIYISKHVLIYTHTKWNIAQPEKEWDFAICNHMNESGGYYLT